MQNTVRFEPRSGTLYRPLALEYVRLASMNTGRCSSSEVGIKGPSFVVNVQKSTESPSGRGFEIERGPRERETEPQNGGCLWLHHGTTLAELPNIVDDDFQDEPNFSPFTDFGKGFYLTGDFDTAKHFAERHLRMALALAGNSQLSEEERTGLQPVVLSYYVDTSDWSFPENISPKKLLHVQVPTSDWDNVVRACSTPESR